jgi:hypothetical protein
VDDDAAGAIATADARRTPDVVMGEWDEGPPIAARSVIIADVQRPGPCAHDDQNDQGNGAVCCPVG